MILVPLALIISAFIPWAITPLLMIGGAFLCFEGVEKVLHMLEARKHKEDPAQSQQRLEKLLAAQDPLKFEKDKIKGAIRTDFILSAEIVAITLGIVAEAPLLNQVLVLSGIALVVTVGVYGLVGATLRLMTWYWLAEKSSALMQALGKGLLIIAPWLMKALSIVGTLAMFLVGAEIVVHGIASAASRQY